MLAGIAGESQRTGVGAHRFEPLWRIGQLTQTCREPRAVPEGYGHSTVPFSHQAGEITLTVADKHGRPTRRENSIDLARNDQPLQRRQQADEMHVRRRETVAEELDGLIGLKIEARQSPVEY